MAVALQARLSNEAKPASPPQSRPVTANKCTRAAAAESALDGWGDSSVLSMWKRGKNVKQLIGTIELSEANEGELDGWIEGLQRLEVVECDRGEDPFHREDVNSSCLTHLIHPSTDGTFCKMILLLKDANQQQKIWQLAQLLLVSWRQVVRDVHTNLYGALYNIQRLRIL
jgi:hypothetical protein